MWHSSVQHWLKARHWHQYILYTFSYVFRLFKVEDYINKHTSVSSIKKRSELMNEVLNIKTIYGVVSNLLVQ